MFVKKIDMAKILFFCVLFSAESLHAQRVTSVCHLCVDADDKITGDTVAVNATITHFFLLESGKIRLNIADKGCSLLGEIDTLNSELRHWFLAKYQPTYHSKRIDKRMRIMGIANYEHKRTITENDEYWIEIDPILSMVPLKRSSSKHLKR